MSSTAPPTRSRVGAVCGLAAAALFGVSTPLAKELLRTVSPQLLAGLLYVGAAVGLSAYGAIRGKNSEARLQRSDLGALAGVLGLGGVLGPLLLLLGLRRVSAVTGSLLLNLEAPFTMLVAVMLFREHLGRHALTAAALIVGGAALLGWAPAEVRADPLGVAAIALACLCWSADNNLTQKLSLRDPIAIVRAKTLGAGSFNVVVALVLGERLPAPRVLALSLLVGCVSYGVSVVLDAHALRLVGAAREAAYFAMAPFFGTLASVVVLHESVLPLDAAALVCMALGTALLLRERHGHRHAHDHMTHEHVHTHDEHHRHAHGRGEPAGDPHSHLHTHEPLMHDHPHVSDLHHRHSHEK